MLLALHEFGQKERARVEEEHREEEEAEQEKLTSENQAKKFVKKMQRFYDLNLLARVPEIQIGNYRSENIILPELSESTREYTDFWKRVAPRKQEFIEFLPQHWQFQGATKAPTILPDFETYLVSVGTEKKNNDYVFKWCGHSLLRTLNQIRREPDNSLVVVECASGLSLVILFALQFALGDELIEKFQEEMGDQFYIGQKNFIYSCYVPRHLRTWQRYQMPVFDLERQNEMLDDIPFGTYLYIRGCLMWSMSQSSQPLRELMRPLQSSFQGENALYVGERQVLGYFQMTPGKATLKPLPFLEVCEKLKERCVEGFNRLPRKRRKSIQQYVKGAYLWEEGEKKPLSGRSVTDVMGITHAYFFVYI